MGYRNGANVLPSYLLQEIQRYIEGEIIYIPKSSGKRRWGELSGTRQFLAERNLEIRQSFEQGKTVRALSRQFHLSEDSIKKIVYGSK